MTEFADSDPRLPTRLEVAGLIRRVQADGGFATVLAKGEPDAGTLMVILTEKGTDSRAFERMPTAEGGRTWTLAKAETREDPGQFADWVARRTRQDPDLWIVELDIPCGERFIG